MAYEENKRMFGEAYADEMEMIRRQGAIERARERELRWEARRNARGRGAAHRDTFDRSPSPPQLPPWYEGQRQPGLGRQGPRLAGEGRRRPNFDPEGLRHATNRARQAEMDGTPESENLESEYPGSLYQTSMDRYLPSDDDEDSGFEPAEDWEIEDMEEDGARGGRGIGGRHGGHGNRHGGAYGGRFGGGYGGGHGGMHGGRRRGHRGERFRMN